MEFYAATFPESEVREIARTGEDQAEVDDYWHKFLQAGGTPMQCGWIKDPSGLTWQIVPRRFMELLRDENSKKVEAVMDAMMTMVKLDVAALEKASTRPS